VRAEIVADIFAMGYTGGRSKPRPYDREQRVRLTLTSKAPCAAPAHGAPGTISDRTLHKHIDKLVLICYKGAGSSQSLSAGLALLSRLQARPESHNNSVPNN